MDDMRRNLMLCCSGPPSGYHWQTELVRDVQPTFGLMAREHHRSISDLPPEVLLIIFHDIHLTLRPPTLYGQLRDWPEVYNPESEDVYPLPGALASVCRAWRDIISTIASFWTCLFMLVGKKPTPIQRMSEHLAWSRDRPIDVCILERPGASTGRDLDQKAETAAQIKAILETMNPHMKRWKLLRIELEYSSSLPCPRIDLMGCADQLETLELECAIDDLTIAADSPPTLGEFHTPALRRLSICGAHFREAYLRPFPQVAMPALLLDINGPLWRTPPAAGTRRPPPVPQRAGGRPARLAHPRQFLHRACPDPWPRNPPPRPYVEPTSLRRHALRDRRGVQSLA